MKITKKTWSRYIGKASRINQKAVDLMQKWIDEHGTEDRDSLIRYANALVMKYGEASASHACNMYDLLAAAYHKPSAEPAQLPTYGEVAKAINGTLKQSETKVPSTVGRMVKQMGADTTLQNAQRDGAQFAWVPFGDTCAFCIVLASRGWQYEDPKNKKPRAEHIHANCDCQYAIRFSEDDTVEGYDPQVYLDMYENADTDGNPQDKINAMRRNFRAKDKDIELLKKADKMIVSGGRIVNLFSDEAEEFANKYYGLIRKMQTDVKRIAKNMGYDESDIQKIKNYLFLDKNRYDEDTGRMEYFHSDCAIAHSWQRMLLGKDIKPHDRVLIEHEMLEMKIKKENPGIDHQKAHEMASEKYNYKKGVDEYYGNLKKHKK